MELQSFQKPSGPSVFNLVIRPPLKFHYRIQTSFLRNLTVAQKKYKKLFCKNSLLSWKFSLFQYSEDKKAVFCAKLSLNCIAYNIIVNCYGNHPKKDSLLCRAALFL